MTDYSDKKITVKEKLRYYSAACLLLFLIGLLFYRNFILSTILCFAAIPGEKLFKKLCIKQRKEKLLLGFRDLLYSVSSAVASGRQLPLAFKESLAQLQGSWGTESDIFKEVKNICDEYDSFHADIDHLLIDFAERSSLEEIQEFASSCRIVSKNGGSLEDICFKSSKVLLDKLSFRDELKALAAQKKLDTALLTSMPLIILLFLNFCSYSYISVLYTTMQGRLVMTASLALIICALLLSLKILEIDI